MTQPWTPSSEPAADSGAADTVTLLDGTTFCISEPAGDIQPNRAQGLFVRDTRMVSRWILTLDDVTPKLLAVQSSEPYTATYISRMPPASGLAESALLVVRRRYIGNRLEEEITVRNVGPDEAHRVVQLRVDADFADLFEVKDGRTGRPDDIHTEVEDDGIYITRTRGRHEQAIRVSSDGDPTFAVGVLRWDVTLAGRSEWSVTVQVTPTVDGTPIPRRHTRGRPVEYLEAARRLEEWRGSVPKIRTADAGFSAVLERSIDDLGALRIFDPHHPQRAVVAAGVPWFMALFGRDSLLTSWMLLPLDSSLAIGTLQALAEHQGVDFDKITEEEPGRILHEIRYGPAIDTTLGGRSVYYGTADATALFVMLLGELRRWGGDPTLVDALLPHADRALEWIETYGDIDGDGFTEYERKSDVGLANQGWKDSWDGISFADGRIATAPIALAEVQAYTYAAFRARAHFAEHLGETAEHQRWTAKAARLKQQFNDSFWLPDKGWFAVGLDRDKRPVDALTSNIGHCLWTGIIDDDKAAAVADRLLSPEMFTGWGIRTLASSMSRYNPMSYHNGSVWPHDNALCASGLMRYGFIDQAQRVITGLLDAAEHFGHRLPELFCGFDRSEFPQPVPYPPSCSPQAWAAASPISFLRTLLRFDPEVPNRRLYCAPEIPTRYLPLAVTALRLDGLSLGVDVEPDDWHLTGLTDTDITLVRLPRTGAPLERTGQAD